MFYRDSAARVLVQKPCSFASLPSPSAFEKPAKLPLDATWSAYGNFHSSRICSVRRAICRVIRHCRELRKINRTENNVELHSFAFTAQLFRQSHSTPAGVIFLQNKTDTAHDRRS